MNRDHAPDAVGPIVGIRVWRIDERRRLSYRTGYRSGGSRPNPGFGQLRSLNWPRLSEGWPGWEPMQAVCKADKPTDAHDSPAPGCGCGAWALKTIARAEEPLLVMLAQDFMQYAGQLLGSRRETWIAAGTVALWGRVVEGTTGYRAQYAYPQSLWLLPPAVFGPEELGRAAERAEDLIPALRSRYGIPVGYIGHSPEWNRLTLRPSVGPFFRWRFDNAGADALGEAIGPVGLPSDRLPNVADALRQHFAGLRYGEHQHERSIADAHLAPTFGEVPLRRLGRAHLAGYRAEPPCNPASARPYSQRTVRRHLAVLRAAVHGAAEKGWFTAAA